MNGKYKGGGCGCGAAKSIGFPQTGGQKSASMKKSSSQQNSAVNTGFSNNGGLFKSKKSSSKTSRKSRGDNMQNSSNNSGTKQRSSRSRASNDMQRPSRGRSERRNMPMANSFIGGGDIISDTLSAMSGTTSPEETPLTANSGLTAAQNTGFPPAASIVNNPTVATPNVAVASTPTPPTVPTTPVTTQDGLINSGVQYEEAKPEEESGGIMGAIKGAFGLNNSSTASTATTTPTTMGGRRSRRSKKGKKKTKKSKKSRK